MKEMTKHNNETIDRKTGGEWRTTTETVAAVRVVFAGDDGGRVLVTEFRGMAINGLFCADVLRLLDLASPSLTLPANTTVVR